MNDNVGLLVVGGVLLWLVYTGKLGGLFGRADQTSASGVPPRPGRNIAGAVGAGACAVAGAAAGMPALGVAAAPLCAAAAPYVVKGAVFVGEKTWEGAKFVGEKAADVAVFAGKGAYSVGKAAVGDLEMLANNPPAYALHRVDQAANIVGTTLKVADRGIDAAYGALPAPLKITAAPAYAVTQLAAKTGGVAVSTVKGASSAVKAVGNFLFGGSGAPPTREQRAVGKPVGFR